MILARQAINGQKLAKIKPKELGRIALVCSPTLIGTGGFVLASKMGSIGIITAIGASGIAFSALLSWALYQEKLKPIHWIAICIITVGVVALKLC